VFSGDAELYRFAPLAHAVLELTLATAQHQCSGLRAGTRQRRRGAPSRTNPGYVPGGTQEPIATIFHLGRDARAAPRRKIPRRILCASQTPPGRKETPAVGGRPAGEKIEPERAGPCALFAAMSAKFSVRQRTDADLLTRPIVFALASLQWARSVHPRR
jgi:hypothetical protein